MDNYSVMELTRMRPLVMSCSACSGAKQLWGEGRVLKLDPQVMMEYVTSVSYYKDVRPCNCEEVLKQVEVEVARLPTVNLGKWNSYRSVPNRGITDYERKMVFTRALDERELTVLKEWLRRKDCPGWTGVILSYGGQDTSLQHSYRATTTWDSSD